MVFSFSRGKRFTRENRTYVVRCSGSIKSQQEWCHLTQYCLKFKPFCISMYIYNYIFIWGERWMLKEVSPLVSCCESSLHNVRLSCCIEFRSVAGGLTAARPGRSRPGCGARVCGRFQDVVGASVPWAGAAVCEWRGAQEGVAAESGSAGRNTGRAPAIAN